MTEKPEDCCGQNCGCHEPVAPIKHDKKHQEDLLDHGVEESMDASDPVSATHIS